MIEQIIERRWLATNFGFVNVQLFRGGCLQLCIIITDKNTFQNIFKISELFSKAKQISLVKKKDMIQIFCAFMKLSKGIIWIKFIHTKNNYQTFYGKQKATQNKVDEKKEYFRITFSSNFMFK